MSSFVLDCSVTMSWCFEDEADAYSDRVLDASRGARILVPAVWPLEVANVLAVAERRKRLAEADSTRFLELLASLPIRSEETSFGRATGAILSLARELGLSSYNAAYLDLAMRSGVPLATRDRRLMAACRRSGVVRFR